MKTLTTIPAAVAALIPFVQLKVTKGNIKEFSDCIQRLETALKKCPKIGETDGKKEHPAIFHYFFAGSDFYICEYDPENSLMFGYGILNGDLPNSEWGYFNLLEFVSSKYLNIDYHFEEQTIEAALYNSYPVFFRKPQSIKEKTLIGKNDPLPETFRDFPYQYSKLKLGTVLQKNNDEVFLQGDDETQFFRDCNRIKQKGHNISYLISEYFSN